MNILIVKTKERMLENKKAILCYILVLAERKAGPSMIIGFVNLVRESKISAGVASANYLKYHLKLQKA